MLEKLTTYISRKRAELKSDLFKEPQQRWHFLLLIAFSVMAIYWGISDYPASRGMDDFMFMAIGVCGGIAGLFGSVAELLPKSQTQLAGILRMWAVLSGLCVIPAMALQLIISA
ncbi:MAG: hypothetical protein WA982_00300 [Rubrobacteraceae bacterium]